MIPTTRGDVLQLAVRAAPGGYRASLALVQEGRFGDPRALAHDVPVTFRAEDLLALANDPSGYGAALTDALFSDKTLYGAWRDASGQAQRLGGQLQVRVQIDPSAAELHRIRWETLCDPETRTPLARSRRTSIVRFIPSSGSVPFVAGDSDQLRALVVVAAAPPPPRYHLPPIDAAAEYARITAALGAVPTTPLGLRLGAPAASPARIRAALQQGHAIVYVVCHGVLVRHNGGAVAPYLWLETEQGQLAPARADELVRMIVDLDSARRPALVLFASCYSADDGEIEVGGPMRPFQAAVPVAIAPQLAAAGVGAVIGMQGLAQQRLIEQFVPAIFRRLLAGEPVDSAIAEARAEVPENDWWMPVLYLRGDDGHLWHTRSATGIEVVGQALHAIVALLSTPAVREVVTQFRRDLQRACEQLPVLQAYKDMHDQLHQLLVRGVNCIDKDVVTRFGELRVRKELRGYISGASQCVRALREISGQLPVAGREILWIEQLGRLYERLDRAMAERDRDQFDVALTHIHSILGTRPVEVNALIRARTESLQLDRLAALMLALAQALAAQELTLQQTRTFTACAEQLGQLNERLQQLVARHGAWQELERSVRLLEQQGDTALIPLHLAAVQDLTAAVCELEQPTAGELLRARVEALGAALAGGDEDRTLACLDAFADEVRYRFYDVDKQLKEHCGTLRLVSSQIEGVLGVLAV